MKQFILSLCIGFLVLTVKGQELSDEAKISVITCGPFQGEVYLAFGHSAFRVYDPIHGIDDVYNYGVFDFDQPNFILNFARGYNYYKLGVSDYPRFQYYYTYYNRFIHEQVLNLSYSQTKKLYEYLVWNALPENQKYRYDYFYDNCATKIRDVVVAALGDEVTFDGSHITTNYTIRELTDLYLQEQPWGDLGIDICLGLPMDKKATPYEYMFLPDYVEAAFDNATITHDGKAVPIVEEKIIVYESIDEEPDRSVPHPTLVFSIFAVLTAALSIWDVIRKKITQWFDIVLFTIVGLVGLLLLMLWMLTDHRAAANNFNLLWALPTHLIAVVAFIKKPRWLQTYFLGVSIILAATLLLWWFLPQQLHTSLIPLVLALLMRSLVQYQFQYRAAKL